MDAVKYIYKNFHRFDDTVFLRSHLCRDFLVTFSLWRFIGLRVGDSDVSAKLLFLSTSKFKLGLVGLPSLSLSLPVLEPTSITSSAKSCFNNRITASPTPLSSLLSRSPCLCCSSMIDKSSFTDFPANTIIGEVIGLVNLDFQQQKQQTRRMSILFSHCCFHMFWRIIFR